MGATALGTGQLAGVQIIIILELPLTLIGALPPHVMPFWTYRA